MTWNEKTTIKRLSQRTHRKAAITLYPGGGGKEEIMPWKKGDDVTFDHGLVEDFDNYKIDEHLYKEIPQETSYRESTIMLTAIRKSDKLAIRQSARIAHSVQRFDRKSTRLSIFMIGIILFQSAILIFQLIMLFSKR